MTSTVRYALVALAVTAVVVAVVAGIMVLGSPAVQRQRRLDEKRVDDLNALERAVDVYRTRHGAPPPDLAALERESGGALNVRDPATRRPYEYTLLGSNRYELCATFAYPSTFSGWRGDFWTHGAGRECFQLEAEEVDR